MTRHPLKRTLTRYWRNYWPEYVLLAVVLVAFAGAILKGILG